MQYLLLIYDDEKSWNGWDEDKQAQWMKRYLGLVDELQAEGVYLGGEKLHDVDTATSVRIRNGQTLLSDGPFAETKEQLGGYFVIECADLDKATSIAARIPSAEIGTVEVRPICSMPE
jgi:hypothetical protein